MKRQRCCDYCGEDLGEVEWSSLDGPLSCGAAECEKWCRQEDQADRADARERAEEDDFGAYR